MELDRHKIERLFGKTGAEHLITLRRIATTFVRAVRRNITSLLYRVAPRLRVPVRVAPSVWWFAANDDVGRSVLKGDFEQEERDFLRKTLQPGMVVFDVGAHHGLYTLIAASLTKPEGRVVCFEPQRAAVEIIEKQIRFNRVDNITIENVAVGESTGSAELYMAADHAYSSLRKPSSSMELIGSASVPVVALDDYIREHNVSRLDLLKLDVEGGELPALKGAIELLGRFRPTLICEVHDVRTREWGYGAGEILDFLEKHNYSISRPTKKGLVVPLNDRPDWLELNVVAIPK